VTAVDGTTTTYTVTVNVALKSDKAITSYALAGATGTITGGASPFAIAVTVPSGTNLTGLIATFATTGASVKVGTTLQSSGSTPNTFPSSPGSLTYTVTAVDGSTADYNVTVTVAVGLNLRRTASFAVLSTGSSITAAGITAVTGDVGATSLTGGGTLNITAGTDYATTGTGQPYVDAQTDLPLVIADAISTTLFPCGPIIAGGDLATVILTPGVTCILNDAAIANTGVVTLNGPGVYMIRTNAALTAQGPSGVAYMGGATDANTTVFWVVQSVVFTSTTGSPVTWKGNLLATTGAATLGGYATLTNGRVLTTAGVTLTSNTITKP